VLVTNVFTRDFSGEILFTLQVSASVILISVLILMMYGWDEVQLAKHASAISGVRPDMKILVFSGGINLEATWVCMLSAIFIRLRKVYLLVFICALFVTLSYQSRAGILVLCISLLMWLYFHKFFTIKKILISLSFFIFLIVFVTNNFDSIPILERFSNIGNEPGSIGRLTIWSYIAESFSNSPLFGYGAGNAIVAVKSLGFIGAEDNVHNLYFQILLDFGLLGFFIYIAMLINALRSDSDFEIKCFILLYCALSIIEFRGAEPIAFFFLSLINHYSYKEVDRN
jgi:O-antigen ligase